MAKFYGNIGFAETVETEPGIWEERIVEYPYYGDIMRDMSKSQPSGGVNNDINVANSISIVADPYANNNFHRMRYVEFMGAKWNIMNVEVQRPRLILTVGGVYHESQTSTTI